MSQSPGMRNLPVPSIVFDAGGADREDETWRISSASNMTVISSCSPCFASMIVTCSMAIDEFKSSGGELVGPQETRNMDKSSIKILLPVCISASVIIFTLSILVAICGFLLAPTVIKSHILCGQTISWFQDSILCVGDG